MDAGNTLQIYHILEMATLADVRRIAMALPGVVEGAALIERPDFGFSVPVKGKLVGVCGAEGAARDAEIETEKLRGVRGGRIAFALLPTMRVKCILLERFCFPQLPERTCSRR